MPEYLKFGLLTEWQWNILCGGSFIPLTIFAIYLSSEASKLTEEYIWVELTNTLVKSTFVGEVYICAHYSSHEYIVHELFSTNSSCPIYDPVKFLNTILSMF